MAPAPQTTDPTTHQATQSHAAAFVDPIFDDALEEPATESADDGTDAGDDPSALVRKLLKGKDKEWDAVASTKSGKKLTLLELPITHTNDLTSLALTNRSLHSLAIPHIYSRFDIVWPDATQLNTSDSKSVDALTYGLSTICLGSTFAHRTRKMLGPAFNMASPGSARQTQKNDYAKYTRKFSLGNGPTDWVADYMISKESGKMLGTLVALAIEKMVNLETFVWDMPTGVLSDIFMALASIPEHSEDGESKLEKVWIRWHDNSDGAPSSSSSPAPSNPSHPAASDSSRMTSIGYLISSGAAHSTSRPTVPYAESRVEFPTFCVLPPLKSLTVLDIDELAYLDEMAVVIEKSKDCLQELRVGMAQKAMKKDFAQPWDGPDLHQVDRAARWPGENTIGDRRLGGVLGVLVGRVYDIRRKTASRSKEKSPVSSISAVQSTENTTQDTTSAGATGPGTESHDNAGADDATEVGSDSQAADHLVDAVEENVDVMEQGTVSTERPVNEEQPAKGADKAGKTSGASRERLDGKLRVRILELERVNLSIHVCTQAFDWSALTSLTILDCVQSELLWKVLRKDFPPIATSRFGSQPSTHKAMEYQISLKSIHTDVVSNSLISFLRDTLAPNSLEVLFLQDRRRVGPQPVTIEQVFKGVIKKHRGSLQKVLLDGSDRKPGSASSTEIARWRNWVIPTEMLLYMTSGRMSGLKELAVSLHYKDLASVAQDSDDESLRDGDYGSAQPRLRLREILFYDDKVAIFKARHGRL
ncbi:hypothetical protein C8035_v009839 [Colletotrichum spinosum]|uniref:F-box domain-containing protein n=1 Tax=Colletotrichum spinosum TaxID=1347390 RepID=A0A4R8PR68_9PEZI|nr:hypothetical protein C8035_v009839 [Colletotrichum spinosum]